MSRRYDRKPGFRRLLPCLMYLVCLTAAETPAQGYPTKSIRYIVPSSAGSGNDFMARIMAADMGQALGQQIIVDNRAGAGGAIAAELAASSPPDGHTMLQISITLVIYSVLHRNLPYDLVRDFAPVTLLAIQPNLASVHSSLPAKSIAELVRLAKARPGEINYSSAGPGSNSFLAAEFLGTLAGIKMVHVPYKGGGPAITALAAGETSLMIGPIPTALPHIKQGRLRGLAVTSSQRLPQFPQYPTIAETIPGYEFSNWYGLTVPAKTPREIIATLNRTATDVLKKPNIAKQLDNAGYLPAGNQPADFDAYIKSEFAKLSKIVQLTGSRAQ